MEPMVGLAYSVGSTKAMAHNHDANSIFMGAAWSAAHDGKSRFTPNRVLTYEPDCDESFQPTIGMKFDSWEDGRTFYERYAHEAGFSVRTFTQHKGEGGVPVWKRFVCAREGWRKDKVIVNNQVKKPKRNVKLTRCGCEAMIGFKRRDDGKYEVARFIRQHTHHLVSPSKKEFLKSSRRNTSIGTSTTYPLLTVEKGRDEKNGCTRRQKNRRDFKGIVEDPDVKTIIDAMKIKQRFNPSFFFDYQIDDKNKLKHIFWADGTSRKNYALFGDVVSFDSTHRTHHDDILFAPFTGVNHHKSCVIFGAAFLANQNIESYTWLFKTFLEAMGGIAPKLIISNEDHNMKTGIRDVFSNTVHRLCMWHILKELPEKVGCFLNSNGDFQSQFRACVWDSETPDEFETKWSSMISQFGLENNMWLTSKFEIRQSWIPVYCLDLPLSGIFRTTMRSEIQNTFFGQFSNRQLALLEFWIRFETALEEQRQEFETDNSTLQTLPELETSWGIELHARDVYTRTIFSLFQAEVVAARDNCDVQKLEQDGEVRITGISDGSGKIREVIYNTSTKVAQCSCKLFESMGIPCSHIIIVLKREKCNEILMHYVLERWTKLASRKVVSDASGYEMQRSRRLYSDTCSRLNMGMTAAKQCEDKMKYLHKAIDDAVHHVLNMETASKVQEFESFGGMTFMEDINIHPADIAHTKGNGSSYFGGL